MSPVISSQQARQFAVQVVRRLRAAGFEALWAGGCVRDQLLGREPSDYDVATSARPEQVRECFGYRRTLAIGASFGVITVRGRQSEGQIEVATFRSDATYSDGRHPDAVTFSSAQEDAQRRDFTMNGLFYDPLDEQVIDFVGGCADLESGIVRAIGDPYQRIAEDKLRMLRAVRFAATFGFQLEPDNGSGDCPRSGSDPCCQRRNALLPKCGRCWCMPGAQAVQLLRDVGLLQEILPEVRRLEQSGSEPAGTSNGWNELLAVLTALDAPTFRVAVAGLLWAICRSDSHAACVAAVCQRWKLSNHERDGVMWLLDHQAIVPHRV